MHLNSVVCTMQSYLCSQVVSQSPPPLLSSCALSSLLVSSECTPIFLLFSPLPVSCSYSSLLLHLYFSLFQHHASSHSFQLYSPRGHTSHTPVETVGLNCLKRNCRPFCSLLVLLICPFYSTVNF